VNSSVRTGVLKAPAAYKTYDEIADQKALDATPEDIKRF
jgi:hypothetical protein